MRLSSPATSMPGAKYGTCMLTIKRGLAILRICVCIYTCIHIYIHIYIYIYNGLNASRDLGHNQCLSDCQAPPEGFGPAGLPGFPPISS